MNKKEIIDYLESFGWSTPYRPINAIPSTVLYKKFISDDHSLAIFKCQPWEKIDMLRGDLFSFNIRFKRYNYERSTNIKTLEDLKQFIEYYNIDNSIIREIKLNKILCQK